MAWLFTARSANAPGGDGTGDYVPGKVLPLANAAPVPEPAQMALLPAGLVMVAWVVGVGRRRQRYVA